MGSGILIFAFVVILLLALAIFAIRAAPVIDGMFKQLLIVLAVLIAIIAIAQRAGVF